MELLARAVEWARTLAEENRGGLGVIVVGWHAGIPVAAREIQTRLTEAGLAHRMVDIRFYPQWNSLAEGLAELSPDPDCPNPPIQPDGSGDSHSVVSILGLRGWIGPGEQAAREFGQKIEKDLPILLESRRRVLLWMTPHIWDTVRQNQPLLAEQWTVFERLAPPDPERLISEVFHRWLLAIIPMRHRGQPERARRRMERFSRQMDTFTPQILTTEQLAWGIVLPWLRTLLDAGEYAKVVEEFRRWAPSIEPIAAAYGLSMLCAGGAEMLLGRTGSAKTTLEEARVRLKNAGHTKGEGIAASMTGQLEAYVGQLDEAELKLAMGTQLGEIAEAKRLVAWNCAILAVLTLLQGREENAHNYLEYGWVIFETEGDIPGLAVTLWVDALRLWWLGDERHAEAETRRVERILTIVRDGPALAACATALAHVLHFIDRDDEARQALERAREGCLELAYAEGAEIIDKALAV